MLMGIAGLFVVSTVIGGTLAALNEATDEGATAEISVKTIEVEAAGTAKHSEKITNAALPGGVYENTMNVYNSASDGYDLYAKVEIYKYWDEADDTLDPAVVTIGTENVSYEYVDGSVVGAQKNTYGFEIVNDWLVQYVDDEQIILYYTKPLSSDINSAQHESANFMDLIRFDASIGNEYTNQTLNLEYVITAVQANNGEDAMASEWGMFPVFDSNGTLVGVFEERDEADILRQSLGE